MYVNVYRLTFNRLWPVVMFFTVIVGVPWLLWRLLVSAGNNYYNFDNYYFIILVEDNSSSIESWQVLHRLTIIIFYVN